MFFAHRLTSLYRSVFFTTIPVNNIRYFIFQEQSYIIENKLCHKNTHFISYIIIHKKYLQERKFRKSSSKNIYKYLVAIFIYIYVATNIYNIYIQTNIMIIIIKKGRQDKAERE